MKRTNVVILILACFLAISAPVMAARRAQVAQGMRGSHSLAFVQEGIRKRLASLPYYSVFDNLYFSFDGDTVILGGEVVRPTTKSDAEHAVRSVEGVENVVNNIEVLPLSSIDERIRAVAYQKIFSHPQFTQYALQPVPPIHIIVKNSNLKLEGVVANNSDKILAGMLANQISGVFSVENNLRVENEKNR
jgi:hyperosmotically inducible protein